MKKDRSQRRKPQMVDHYDFAGGVRGKYFARYKRGTNTVLLDPDVAKVFPTSAAVNNALRKLAQSKRRLTGAAASRRKAG